MFFHSSLERNILVLPHHLGPHLRDELVSKLMKEIEGTCSDRHGFVLAVTDVDDIGKGLILPGITGYVSFPVKFKCVHFRLFKGEILEATVTMVNKMGFFAEAGPAQIFVSNLLMPGDMEFQSGDVPKYTTSDGSVKIQKDSEVRLKIMGTCADVAEIFIEGEIEEEGSSVSEDESLADKEPDDEHNDDVAINMESLDLTDQFCIGDIRDGFLGVINDPGAASK